MPQRNTVPSLKLLAIRQIAWPEALHKLDQMQHLDELFGNKRKSRGSQNAVLLLRRGSLPLRGLGVLASTVESIINAWIRLSDYYCMRLDEIMSINYLFGFRNITTLDFLHQGFNLRDGTDVATFSGVLPTAVKPQAINPFTWQAIVTLLRTSGNAEILRQLHIWFGLTSTTTHASTYHFMKTFCNFSKLTKLVVHGVANDLLMQALGTYCRFLKYLDIRHSEVTEAGVLRLLLKRPADVQKFKNNPHFTFLETHLRPCARTLEYFDMSTVRKEGKLLDQDRVVRHACPKMRGTPNRLFFLPEGSLRFRVQLLSDQKDLPELRNKAMSSTRSQFADTLVELTAELRCYHHHHCSINGVEFRVTASGEEASVLYLHKYLLVLEIKMKDLTAVTVISHTISTCDFISLESLAHHTPHLKHVKASLKGTLSPGQTLPELQTATIPLVHRVDTLKSIVMMCSSLVYLEARELLLAPGKLTDEDVKEMMSPGCPHLEVFRLLFTNDITLVPGVKQITLSCPNLKIIGDLKAWSISFSTMSRFSLNLNAHNLDLSFEHDGILYHSNTPCKEFYH